MFEGGWGGESREGWVRGAGDMVLQFETLLKGGTKIHKNTT